MPDLFQFYGNDLALSATGDLLVANGSDANQQRVLRRLLTNPALLLTDGTRTQADYLFHPDYGAGAAQDVGSNLDLAKIRARIKGQMFKEVCVARNPAPVITLTQLPGNILTCAIQYTDALTGQTAALKFDINY